MEIGQRKNPDSGIKCTVGIFLVRLVGAFPFLTFLRYVKETAGAASYLETFNFVINAS